MGLVLVLAVTLVTFVLFFASGVDPARFACGKSCTQDQRDVTRKALGYDKPTLEQWTAFLGGLVKGRDFPADPELRKAAPDLVTHCEAPCFGYSHLNARTVNDLIWEAAPVTVSLAVVALVMWLIGGVLFGILAAITKGSFLDRGIVGLTLIAYAFPSFFIGVFLLKYVVVKWQVFNSWSR
jgi:peptide/nickel transport system permease protein